jgi:hypothetical protein
MALQRTRRPRIRSGRSLRSLGSPLNAYPLERQERKIFSNSVRSTMQEELQQAKRCSLQRV